MLHVLDRMIQSDPATRAAQPRIAGTRISVADVAVLHVRLGHSAEEIAGTYAAARGRPCGVSLVLRRSGDA